jgi:hypothetical protein
MTSTVTATLAIAACALLLIGVVVQVGLSVGAPWGAAAYGGRAALADGRVPGRYRVTSAITAVVLVAMGVLLLLRGGLLGDGADQPALAVMCWVLAALFALNTVGNAAGRHRVERQGMGAVTACLTVLCVLLAIG